MFRFIAVSVGVLLFGLHSTMVAQELQVDSPRRIVSRAIPVYPELARKMGLEGTVKLQVTVAPDGIVKSVQAVEAAHFWLSLLRIQFTSLGGCQQNRNPKSLLK
jgi:hypothetical protein